MKRPTAGAVLGVLLADVAAANAHTHVSRAIDSIRAIANASAPLPGEDAYAQGKRLLAGDDAAGALGAFRQALMQAPLSVDGLNGMAVSYDRLGRSDLARVYYEAALAIEPTSPMLLNNLGYSLFLQGKGADARAPLETAAAGDDPHIAQLARRTLALIDSARGPAVVRDVAEPAPRAWIERTDEGEQRLVFGPLTSPHEAVSVVRADSGVGVGASVDLGVETALVAVAAPWTERDDATLLSQVVTQERAEIKAQAQAQAQVEAQADADAVLARARARAAAKAAPVLALDSRPAARTALSFVAAVYQPASPIPPSPRARLIPDARTAPSLTALNGAAAARDPALAARWTGVSRAAARAIAKQRPRAASAAAFDSDDATLNAFATRLRDQAQRPVAPNLAARGDLDRFVARIREA